MAKQPAFRFGSPATGVYFTGREREVSIVVRRMEDHINVVVTSPRRYGKTSLLWKAAEDFEQLGGAAARIRVNQATSTGELVAALLAELARCEASSKRVLEFIGRLRVRPTMSVDNSGRMTYTFEPAVAAADARATLAEVVDRFAELAEKRPVAVIFDEFQVVAELDPQLPRVFKALSDGHPDLSLVFCGSDRHLMSEIFIDHAAPLLGMAEVLVLGPLSTEVLVPFLIERSAASGIRMTEEAARRVCELARPAPNDVQHLAYETIPLADPAIDVAVVDAALAELLSHRANDYAATFEQLTGAQKRLLRLLARRPIDQLQAAEVVREVGAASGSGVRRAMTSLAARTRPLVAQEGRTWRVDDPFFKAWLTAAAEVATVELEAAAPAEASLEAAPPLRPGPRMGNEARPRPAPRRRPRGPVA